MSSEKDKLVRDCKALRKKLTELKRLVAKMETVLDRLETALDSPMKPYDRIEDSEGTLIKVGSRVLDEIGLPQGTVTSIIPLDGDADDEGRPVAIGPTVKVLFDDGTEDEFDAHWSAKGPEDMDAPFVCLNLTIADVDD